MTSLSEEGEGEEKRRASRVSWGVLLPLYLLVLSVSESKPCRARGIGRKEEVPNHFDLFLLLLAGFVPQRRSVGFAATPVSDCWRILLLPILHLAYANISRSTSSFFFISLAPGSVGMIWTASNRLSGIVGLLVQDFWRRSCSRRQKTFPSASIRSGLLFHAVCPFSSRQVGTGSERAFALAVAVSSLLPSLPHSAESRRIQLSPRLNKLCPRHHNALVRGDASSVKNATIRSTQW